MNRRGKSWLRPRKVALVPMGVLALVAIPADSQKQQWVDPSPGSNTGVVAGWYRVLPSGDVRGPCTELVLRNGEGMFVLWLVPSTKGLEQLDGKPAKRLLGPCY